MGYAEENPGVALGQRDGKFIGNGWCLQLCRRSWKEKGETCFNVLLWGNGDGDGIGLRPRDGLGWVHN